RPLFPPYPGHHSATRAIVMRRSGPYSRRPRNRSAPEGRWSSKRKPQDGHLACDMAPPEVAPIPAAKLTTARHPARPGGSRLPGPAGERDSPLERQPQDHPLRHVAQEPGRAGDIVACATRLALDPLGVAIHVAAIVERDHQLEIEEEAALVEVGRARE